MTAIRLAESHLRQLISSGCYEEAREALPHYVKLLKGLPPGDSQTPDVLEQAKELLEWAHRMTSAGRAHASAQLTQLSAAVPYQTRKDPHRPTWRLEA
jgi:hypothetical protein